MCRNARELYRFWSEKRAYLDYEAFDPTSDFELSITDTLSELTFGESFALIDAQRIFAKKESARLRSLGIKATSDTLIGPSSEIHEANNLLLKVCRIEIVDVHLLIVLSVISSVRWQHDQLTHSPLVPQMDRKTL